MDALKENISFLKKFVKRRETYIRFSPLGTLLSWLLFAVLYFVGNYFDWVVTQKALFIGTCGLSIVIVTLLSLRNSLAKGENAFPSSIKSVVVNLWIIIISFFALLSLVGHSYLVGQSHIETIILACIFYWLLVMTSRQNLPNYITYFGWLVFVCGVMFSAWFMNTCVEEGAFLLFGIGHIVMAGFLKHNNDNNG